MSLYLIFCSSQNHQTVLSYPGIGGNLVAIQSSRISTHLHFHCAPGEVPTEARGCYYPCRTFCGTGQYCVSNSTALNMMYRLLR